MLAAMIKRGPCVLKTNDYTYVSSGQVGPVFCASTQNNPLIRSLTGTDRRQVTRFDSGQDFTGGKLCSIFGHNSNGGTMSHQRTYLNTGNAGERFSSLTLQKWGEGRLTSVVTGKPEVVEFSIRNGDGEFSHSVRLDTDQVDDLIEILTELRGAISVKAQKIIPQVIFKG
jgi:hypothetical protein